MDLQVDSDAGTYKISVRGTSKNGSDLWTEVLRNIRQDELVHALHYINGGPAEKAAATVEEIEKRSSKYQ